jgi:hypothetical protein
MRRTASEVLRSLEMRVARLERTSSDAQAGRARNAIDLAARRMKKVDTDNLYQKSIDNWQNALHFAVDTAERKGWTKGYYATWEMSKYDLLSAFKYVPSRRGNLIASAIDNIFFGYEGALEVATEVDEAHESLIVMLSTLINAL